MSKTATPTPERRQSSRQQPVPGELPRSWPWLRHWFHRYVRFYVARHFTAVRVARTGLPPSAVSSPLIIYLNHPSWWDPLIAALLAMRFFPDRQHYAPMDAGELDRYRFFKRLGFFGVEQDSLRGGRQFLATSRRILSHAPSTLWITPQGAFCDPRAALQLHPGLAHLAHQARRIAVLPLAIEYPFWDQPLPEVLTRFGEVQVIDDGTSLSVQQWQRQLTEQLERTQQSLAELACRRDPALLETVLAGADGGPRLYRLWQRIRRRNYRSPHASAVRQAAGERER